MKHMYDKIIDFTNCLILAVVLLSGYIVFGWVKR
jgi:hypothetical protein